MHSIIATLDLNDEPPFKKVIHSNRMKKKTTKPYIIPHLRVLPSDKEDKDPLEFLNVLIDRPGISLNPFADFVSAFFPTEKDENKLYIDVLPKPTSAPNDNNLKIVDKVINPKIRGIALIHRGHILLVQEKYSLRFGFPKGHRQIFARNGEWAETSLETAKRELQEETGINLDDFPHKILYDVGRTHHENRKIRSELAKKYNFKGGNAHARIYVVEIDSKVTPEDIKMKYSEDEIRGIAWIPFTDWYEDINKFRSKYNESSKILFHSKERQRCNKCRRKYIKCH